MEVSSRIMADGTTVGEAIETVSVDSVRRRLHQKGKQKKNNFDTGIQYDPVKRHLLN